MYMYTYVNIRIYVKICVQYYEAFLAGWFTLVICSSLLGVYRNLFDKPGLPSINSNRSQCYLYTCSLPSKLLEWADLNETLLRSGISLNCICCTLLYVIRRFIKELLYNTVTIVSPGCVFTYFICKERDVYELECSIICTVIEQELVYLTKFQSKLEVHMTCLYMYRFIVNLLVEASACTYRQLLYTCTPTVNSGLCVMTQGANLL